MGELAGDVTHCNVQLLNSSSKRKHNAAAGPTSKVVRETAFAAVILPLLGKLRLALVFRCN